MRTILILMDTLRRDHLKIYDPETRVKTDNISSFAKDSIVFDNHFAGSLPCMPARRDIYTGKLNFLERSWGPIEIYDNTLPKVLHRKGIPSHIITDHAHYFRIGGENYCQQFDTYEFFRGQESDPWISLIDDPYMPEEYYGTVKRQYQCNRTMFKKEDDFPSVKCFNSACEWLEKNKDAEDFFLMVETFDPHEPFDVPQKYLDMYEDDYDGPQFDLPKYHKIEDETEEALTHIRNRYSSLITMTDHHFGTFIKRLKELDMYEDTLIILTTDHGYCLGKREFIGKNYMPYFNEISNIPLIMHMPGSQHANTRKTELTQNIDLMPTILDYENIQVSESVKGKSIFNIIEKNEKIHDYVIYGCHGLTVNICDGEHTYFRAPRDNTKCFEYTTSLTTIRDWLGKEIPEKIEVGKFLKNVDFPVYKVPVLKNPIVTDDQYLKKDHLFNIIEDYNQKVEITDETTIKKMENLLVRALKENDSPEEQIDRLGLNKNL